jgi:hypothetical protein
VSGPREYLSVHDSHCCPRCGCKYGRDDCPVASGTERGIRCEECQEELSAGWSFDLSVAPRSEDLLLAVRLGRGEVTATLPARCEPSGLWVEAFTYDSAPIEESYEPYAWKPWPEAPPRGGVAREGGGR